MFLQIKIEQETFKVSVGKGFNNWVWLAHYASRMYAKNIYPQGTYLPTVLYLQNIHKQVQYHPHPKQKISTYLQSNGISPQQIRCIVKIRKANHSYSQFQKRWEKQAYEREQYFITFNFCYLASNINKKKDFILKVKTQYSMADEMKHLFSQKDYPAQIKTLLHDRPIGPNESKFEGSLRVPLGSASHRLFYYERDHSTEDYGQIQLSQKKMKKDEFLVRQEPIYVPLNETLSKIQVSMRIEEDINKSLQQKELQTKKRNASSSLCCFTFQQLWDNIQKNYADEISLHEYEKSTIERIKLCIQKSINELYQIFFYYFILENQQKDKKEDLGIVYQDIMHFLRDYAVIGDLVNLNNFLEFYNADESKFKKIQDTLDVNNHAVKFPQFIVILLRSIQFVQTSTFLMKGETFDSAATKIFQKIIQIDAQIGFYTPLRLNLRQNPKIISFVRGNSQKLKKIFCWMFKNSIQFSLSNPIIIMKEELKQLIMTFSLVENNVDKIVNECFKDLHLNEEGIFYYEFLMVIKWLAMAVVTDQKQEEDLQNQEQESIMIVQKIKYLIAKVQLD